LELGRREGKNFWRFFSASAVGVGRGHKSSDELLSAKTE
jgi:hypothetical protein